MGTVDPSSFWPGFGDSTGLPKITCTSRKGVAREVLESHDIPYSSFIEGGSLDGLDIKLMDAMQAIKVSLLEESANTGKIYEPIMSPEGKVEFKAIGEYSGLSGSDIYYELQTGAYKEECTGVMITGKKPLAYRRPIEWKSILEAGKMQIYDTGILFNNKCLIEGFNQYCTIVYDDPQMSTEYEDGIDNFYELSKERGREHDNLLGYAYYIGWSNYDKDTDENVSIKQTNSTRVLIELDLNEYGLGTLRARPIASGQFADEVACWENDVEVNFEDGVPVPIPEHFRFETTRGVTEDKLEGIESVYIIGYRIEELRGVPFTDAAAVLEEPPSDATKAFVSIHESRPSVISLIKSEHFEVAYEGSGTDRPGQPSIVFANNSLKTDPLGYVAGGKTHFYIDPMCTYALHNDGTVVTEDDGYILPLAKRQGFLVQQAFALVNLDTPSIEIYHPNGWNNRAREIAENLEYLAAPLVVVSELPPIGFNGNIIDQVSGIIDHDPTTAQDFEDTPLELANDEMSGGNGFVMNLTFLDEDQVAKLSGALFDFMNSGTGIESTYICGPSAEPELGGTAPNGGIVNSISYSYQDSNSYTISVNSGPKILGDFAQPGVGGPAFKATEDVSLKGVITQDIGNGIHYKVRIDGFGERVAFSMTPNILRVGDIVNVSIHNNPVEA